MAAHITQSIYQVNANGLFNLDGTPATSGLTFSFATGSFIAYPVKAPFVVNGATMVSVIEVFPTGLNQVSNYYYTTATVYAINDAANA